MKLVFRCISLLLIAALFAPATALAGKKMEVGLQDDGVFLNRSYYDWTRGFANAESLHVTWLRVNVLWSQTLAPGVAAQKKAPKKATYDWSRYDALIAAAKARGIHVQITLTGPAPAWATKDHKVGPYKPSAKYFGSFAYAATQHFKKSVYRFAIWNEPNLVSWLKPLATGPYYYRHLYAAAYKNILKADKKARVLFAETSPYALKGRSTSPLGFTRAVLCVNKSYTKRNKKCPAFRADGFALHPYDARHKPTYKYPGADNVTIGTLSRLTRALDKLQHVKALRPRSKGHMPVYLTEFSYVIFKKGKRVISEKNRARYLAQAFEIARKNPRVRQTVQYQLVQPPAGSPWAFWQSYLVTPIGTHTSAYNWLKAWADRSVKKKGIATR
jgi:hypothetical protein